MSIEQQDLFAILCRFGKSVVVRPHNGTERTITGVADRRSSYRDVGGMMKNVRLLLLTVLKDETDTTYGGIMEPDTNYVARLDDVEYRFTGTINDENSYGWQLEFQASAMKRMGTNVSGG